MNNKIKSLLMTLFIILLLVVAGPAQAFVLNLSLDNSSPSIGQIITFTADVEIPQGERLPIQQITLKITGPQSINCIFAPNGSVISGCAGLSITPVLQQGGYGYGYGYGYFGYGYSFGYGYGYSSSISYSITLNTAQLGVGAYRSELIAKIQNKEFSKGGPDFTIQTNNAGGGSSLCRTQWSCSAWSDCQDNFQIRTCEKISPNCQAPQRPAQIRVCSQNPIVQITLPQFPGLNSQQDQVNSNLEEEIKSENTFGSNPITGAVTGVFDSALSLGKAFLAIGSILLIILVLSTILLIRKIRSRTAPKYRAKDFY